MITVKSLSHRYSDQSVLNFKDWDIPQGGHWLMLGNSGSGKSTLLHILAGLLKPTQGEVAIHGTVINRLTEKNLDHFRGQHIGLVFQRPHLIKSLTIGENLLIAQSFAGLPVDHQRIKEVLASLGIPDQAGKYPSQLSQGQLQRVSIARAVINKPALLLADEPTSSLDDDNASLVLDLLIRQSDLSQSTLIVATHDKRVKDRIQNEYTVRS